MKAQIAWIVDVVSPLPWQRIFYDEEKVNTWVDSMDDIYVKCTVRKVAILDVVEE